MKKIIKNKYALCIPLISTDTEKLMADYEQALTFQPDFIEWRRDAISERIDDIAVLQRLRTLSSDTGLIYTYRCPSEGGLTPSDDQKRLTILKNVFASGLCDYIDTEASHSDVYIHEVIRAKNQSQTGLILSYHHFQKTPDADELKALLEKIKNQSPDVIKLALTARHIDDVRRAASVIAPFSYTTNKPIIFTMMRRDGAIIRAIPEIFGGSITFAASDKASAPGQLSPSEIKAIRNLLHLKDAADQPTPAPNDNQQQNIALVGYMGTGKTTVSRLLSQMTGMPLIDTDQRVEALAGKTITDIFEQDGEAAFRLLEHIVLRDALKKKGHIISTGGGIVLRDENRRLLKNEAFTAHLTAKPKVIAKRLADDTTRPLLANSEDLLAKIQTMLGERQPFYNGFALTLETDALSPEEIAKGILDAYHHKENN